MDKIKNAVKLHDQWEGEASVTITTLYSNPEVMNEVIYLTCNYWKNKRLTCIAGIEARGFITGSIIANELSLPFIPIRKKGKLPLIHTQSRL